MSTATFLSVAFLLVGGALPTIWGMRTEERLSEAAVVHDDQGSNASLTMAIKAGALFAERYKLLSKTYSQGWPASFPGYKKGTMLGRGAFGETWLAKDESTGGTVAVKFFYRDTTTGTVLLNMANANPKELAALNSMKNECNLPSEIRKLRSGKHAHRFAQCFVNNVNTRSGPSYMVLEIAGTMNLQDYLEKNTPSAEEVLLIAMMLFEGLVQMEGEYVHRDIKPANLMVTISGGRVVDLKYIDFGLTVSEGASGGVAGTPFYMPPDLWPVSPASTRARSSHDVYSVGETLYDICCGDTFHGKIWDEAYDSSNENKKKLLETVKPGSKCKSTRSAAYQDSDPLIELFGAVIGQMLANSGRASGSELLKAMAGYWPDMPQEVPAVEEQDIEVFAPSELPFLTRCHQDKSFWFEHMVQCCGEEKPDPLREAICAKPCGGNVAFVPGTRCVDDNSKQECKDPLTMKFSDTHFCCVPIAWDTKNMCQYVGPLVNKRRQPLPPGVGWLWMQM